MYRDGTPVCIEAVKNVVPVRPGHSWGEVKEFARGFAEAMAREAPDAYVANMSKARRKGKIFIDFFRNDFSSTAIVPFSLRAREGAPIAWPISWNDLKKSENASDFRLENLTPRHFAKAKKQVEEFMAVKQPLKL
jgi:bifunctional non-homologous end joining protein LigD